MKVEIVIKCPKCFKKALFKSLWTTNTYPLYPSKNGKVICTYCGYNGNLIFSNKCYYYQIPIHDKVLYARSLNHLLILKNYFENGGKITESDLDFPKTFYKFKDEIVRKINKILIEETS